jgi:rhodanese-related sulfurtransferase
MASRARDCIPLSVPLILLDLDVDSLEDAAAALKGKGFTVLGVTEDAINLWATHRGTPASTEILSQAPRGLTLLDVGDPKARPPDGAVSIPTERLWSRVAELDLGRPIAVVSGAGVRAALAVGILERAGARDVALLRT